MGERSVVFRHIEAAGNDSASTNRKALNTYPFDDRYPLPNIFHIEGPPRYQRPSIFIGGTFKEIEDDWATWLEQFAALFSALEAVSTEVILDCWRGRFAWTLQPELLAGGGSVRDLDTLIGQRWVITACPPDEAELDDLGSRALITGCTVPRVPASRP